MISNLQRHLQALTGDIKFLFYVQVLVIHQQAKETILTEYK